MIDSFSFTLAVGIVAVAVVVIGLQVAWDLFVKVVR